LRFNLRILQPMVIVLTSLLVAGTAKGATTTNHKTLSSKSHKSSKSGKSHSTSKKKSAKSHGQRTIDEARTVQIQQALIREHYLTGDPSGRWDQSTKDALARFQEANGWQTKSVPDSRALIKLGLGPDKKGLLNPDTAVMTSPHELGTPAGSRPGGSSQQ
jgi:hypothetical protein